VTRILQGGPENATREMVRRAFVGVVAEALCEAIEVPPRPLRSNSDAHVSPIRHHPDAHVSPIRDNPDAHATFPPPPLPPIRDNPDSHVSPAAPLGAGRGRADALTC
jgi:hypothetical protein